MAWQFHLSFQPFEWFKMQDKLELWVKSEKNTYVPWNNRIILLNTHPYVAHNCVKFYQYGS